MPESPYVLEGSARSRRDATERPAEAALEASPFLHSGTFFSLGPAPLWDQHKSK